MELVEWNLSNLVDEMKQLILSYIEFASLTYVGTQSPFASFSAIELEQQSFSFVYECRLIFIKFHFLPLRLISTNWNQLIQFQHKAAFITVIKMYASTAIPTLPHSKWIDKSPAMAMRYIKKRKIAHDVRVAKRARFEKVKDSLVNDSNKYTSWTFYATFVYICLLLFLMLCASLEIINLALPFLTFYSRFAYHICFVPIWILLISIPSKLTYFMCTSQQFESAKRFVRNIIIVFLLSSGLACFVGISFLLILLNIGTLYFIEDGWTYINGNVFPIPWLITLLPFLLLIILIIMFATLASAISCVDLIKACKNTTRLFYYPMKSCYRTWFVLFFSICLFLFVLFVGLALEFPAYIPIPLMYIPAFVGEFGIIVIAIVNYAVLKKHDTTDTKIGIKCLLLCLFGASLTLNHILVSIAWYQWIPYVVAILQGVIPLTLFYLWTAMMLQFRP